MMEAIMPNDSVIRESFVSRPSMEDIRNHKRRLTLDLNAQGCPPTSSSKRTLLTSPDVRMLKLASPELERFILQQSGLVQATPTPGGPHALSSVLAMRPAVTGLGGDQAVCHDDDNNAENCARGFVDALRCCQESWSSGAGSTVVATAPMIPVPVDGSGSATSSAAIAIDVAALPSFSSSHGINTVTDSVQSADSLAAPADERPLRPSYSCSSLNQDQLKLERKRLRNRIAATKCRHRKLERISQLEDQVERFRRDNGRLKALATDLRHQVDELKREVLHHSLNGCPITLPSFCVL